VFFVTRLLKRTIALIVIGLVVSLVVYVSVMPAMQKQAGGRRAARGDGPVPVVAAPARVADVAVYLDGVGTAKARNTVTVRPQVDGKILSINFKEGQEVKRGDVLAKIDPATYQAQFDQAAAKKTLDESLLANAQRDLERYAKLGGNVVAQKTIDTQRALVAQLTAQIKLDDAAIANAKAFLDYTTIVAPIDGRTGIRMVDEGNLVRASDVGIVMITEVRPISVLFTLPQQQLVQVNKAMAQGPVSVEAIDGDGKATIDRGTLQVVDNQIDQTTGTVRIKAEFPNATMQLWPGQFVNVRILIDTLKQVVVVPTPAVQRGPNGTFAYVVQGERVALRLISVTQQNETEAVVAKGIEAADRVVTTGFMRLKDGSEIVLSQPGGDPSAPAGAPTASKGGAEASEAPRGEGRRKRDAEGGTTAADDAAREERRRKRREERAKAGEGGDTAADDAAREERRRKRREERAKAEEAAKPREAEARKPDGSATQ
jgi:multidrug efflux system membrane fusion protein